MEFRPLPPARLALFTALSVVALGACQRQETPSPATQADAPAPAAAPAPAPYVPPTADQLYQLVAPIALFPDKLLAQTLAASVYPDQVVSAQDWLRNNRTLSATDRLQAAAAQPWDPSVKALTAFPDVVDQLAGNGDWTRSLGDAYAHDPNQVLDAVQVMRQRAQAQGHLRSTPQQRVQVVQRTVVEPAPAYADAVPPPTRTIVIEPAQPDVVYVPRYDPDVVYGAPVNVYREYRYRPPRPYYDTGDLVTAGIISFGVGVLVGDALEHHHHSVFGWLEPAPPWHSWGWNNWGVNWNAPPSAPNYVVYRNSVYAPRTTIINNHYDNRSYVHNDYRGAPPPAAPMGGPGGQQAFAATHAPGAAMTAAAMGARMPAAAFGPTRAQPGAMPQSMPHFTHQMLQAGRPVAAMPPPVQRLPSPGTPAAMAAARDPRLLPGFAQRAAAPPHTVAMAQPNAPRAAPSMPVPQFHGRPVPQALTPTPVPHEAVANRGGMPEARVAEPSRHGDPGMQPSGFAREMARTQPPRQAMPADAPRAQAWHAPAPEREARAPEMPREAMRAPMPEPRQEQRVARFSPPPRMPAPRPAESHPAQRPTPAHHDGRHDHDHHES
ncbi:MULTISPECIES: DUF3300 domain-containing protein [Xanthomonas]|uniref:DUF3300 domain-containing protein n=1 Tax=Xanthomonas rydalmerensis TaxID=3046274 RepID=A0ABZ0JSD0_9XANT|nr:MULTISPECIES: DUF3300 domain-containing protein [unclassified Xanthomonas]MBB5876199.1 hypothetical protein [Xanthomonas sp. 3498]WOS42647.1 DUF3300 domain-containing protein [Xanthomonas sp. DM-2023]WOS46833.1 DUF3300 domain-containing protein [Xanthomonas sp. DM-2023]WOS51013.1 DUF3300 domain-containing protein [Xanthomonas sp. DM-2023]WOS55193.1 DUF3300 domain-containing protein [Xanthomonas sp. DM-2023]